MRTLAESSISSQADHRDRAAEPHHSDNGSPRDLHEDARDVARALASTPEYVEACRRRKKVEMLFAHLKRILRTRPIASRWSKRGERRVPLGRHRPKSEEISKADSRTRANLRHMRRRGSTSPRPQLPRAHVAIFRARGSSTRSVNSGRPVCANSGHSPTAWRPGQIDPLQSFGDTAGTAACVLGAEILCDAAGDIGKRCS